MGGDLVEQQEGRDGGRALDQPRMGEDQPHQQGLLLAGGAERGRDGLLRVGDFEIEPVGTEDGAAGGAIGGTSVGPDFTQLGFERGGRNGLVPVVEQRRDGEAGGGEAFLRQTLGDERFEVDEAIGAGEMERGVRARPSAVSTAPIQSGSALSSSRRLRWRMAVS